MITSLVCLGILLLAAAGIVTHWGTAVRQHQRRLDQLDVRIHVNGIRGKSSVTRLVAGVLREGGFVTVAKTTGSAARVIGPMGEETPIIRRGAPTINEQIDVVAAHVTSEVEALVIECMAVRPLYQKYSQDFMVRSDITIITNVREDHQEEMGETLEEIADSLSATIPENGVLITAEDRSHLRQRLERNAAALGSRLVHADPLTVSDEDMAGFDYVQFKENVAIGLEVARLLGIPRQRAIEGMWKSVPDVGVVRLKWYPIRDKQVLWIPLFAANDRESVIGSFQTLAPYFPEDGTVVALLNNRTDRGRRAELFAQMVPHDLAHQLDHVITLGAYESQVTRTMVEGGYPASRIHSFGDDVKPTLDELLDGIADLIPGQSGVLIGMVNIHTHQAELLLEHFAEHDGENVFDEIVEASRPHRAPAGTARLHRVASRRVPVTARRSDR
ncbi:MAG TPA: poly-gamma-glutamate synthase PgsB [Intrasporangium sp.]|jgi:UDP-N-acetylmuramyl pentapeptide synthase|uniref:poly-gamma-glutamate synthase PgsB n=1 Tax=Intrasporangium sp. TaxID=1925024 RepID=UPI002F920E05